MTVEEILAALQAIIDENKPADPAADPAPMSDDQVARYEALEEQLRIVRRSEEIVKRNAAYGTVVKPRIVQGNVETKSEYERSFDAYLRTGKPDQIVQRAQSEAIGSAGGYLVPDEWSTKLIEKRLAYGGLAEAAEQITTADGRPYNWLTNDETGANLAEITPENALWSTGADLSFGLRTLGAYKYTTVGANQLPLKVSYELLQDAAFDLRGFISRKFGIRIARKEANDFVNGTGVNEPQGIISTQGGLASATAFAGAAPTYAELLSTVHQIDPEYRTGASWLMNDATLAKIQGIVDTTGRPLLWNTSNDMENGLKGMTLLGYPVVIDQAMPNYTDGSGNKWGVFGNLKDAYIVRRVKGFEMVVLNELYAQYGQVGFMGWERADGMVQDPNAALILKND